MKMENKDTKLHKLLIHIDHFAWLELKVASLRKETKLNDYLRDILEKKAIKDKEENKK